MRSIVVPLCLLVLAQAYPAVAMPRLPRSAFDVVPPSDDVSGPRGYMRTLDPQCVVWPTANLRRRIVDIAVQEWAFFGSHTVDLSNTGFNALPPNVGAAQGVTEQGAESTADLNPAMDTTIAGYWSATPDGASVLRTQNAYWYAAGGQPARWAAPWSAAFMSWVMCQAGLGDPRQFHRSIAHRDYIDQAILARDRQDPFAAYYAYDLGEQMIEPGDLLCDSMVPARYENIEERRRDIGRPAPAHCDLVVKVAADRIVVVGGNILGAVTLAIWPTERDSGGYIRPDRRLRIDGTRQIFAHLKLRAAPIESNAMDNSPTVKGMVQRPN
jgi:hypothetical protein